MAMDEDVARWVLDFLARQPIDDSTLTGLLNSLPVSDTDSNLKKLLILRKIEFEISNGMVSESVLDLLESLEELEFRDKVKISEAMKKAYMSVAVDCTVRVLENEGLGKYFEVVRKIWRGKIGCMMKVKNGGMVSYELINWKDDIENGVWDEKVCKEVLEKWKEMDVVESVREFVKDAREKMGPSFLEVVFEEMSDEALELVFGFNVEDDEDEGSHDQADADAREKPSFPEVNENDTTADAREKPSFPKVVADDMSADAKKKVFGFNVEDEDSHDQTNATEASLKEGNKTVRDKSTDGAAGPASRPQLPTPKKSVVKEGKNTAGDENTGGVAGPASRPQLPTRKKSVVSPVKKDENPKPLRRKRKAWSNLEEGTLRAGVKKYGSGNWTFILNEYKDIFDDRTAVDLKDKWRNLIV